jgi:hypothetical protein
MLPADVVEGDLKKLKRPQSKVSKHFSLVFFSLMAKRNIICNRISLAIRQQSILKSPIRKCVVVLKNKWKIRASIILW